MHKPGLHVVRHGSGTVHNGGGLGTMLALCLCLSLLAGDAARSLAELIPSVQIRDTSIGPVLADERGFTLYTYERDPVGLSTCYGECAKLWPPFRPPSKSVDETGNFTIQVRQDGTLQWAYKHKPLYSWSGERKVGDVLGDGKSRDWVPARP